MPKISSIKCFKVLNSRADWTLRTQVTLDNGISGIETVPDGASKGENEAVYVPIEQALATVNDTLNQALNGTDVFDQKLIDEKMIELDGTGNKQNLGGNSILSVSLAAAKAAANSKNVPLYMYLAEMFGNKSALSIPTPVFNIINGGKHAQNGLSFQEFMLIPGRSIAYDKAVEMGVCVYHSLKKELKSQGFDTGVGDEGGFAPEGFNPQKALESIREATAKDFEVGKEVFFGMDVAAESFWNGNGYDIKEEGLSLDREGLLKYYAKLLEKYELIYLEDPFYEKDKDGWELVQKSLGKKLMIVGDDLVVSNPKFLRQAISDSLINSVIVKPNQVGTLTETLEFVKMAKASGLAIVVSHRSGDTAEDTFIADLAVGVGAEFIKSGAPARGERVAKYNRLLEIFHSL